MRKHSYMHALCAAAAVAAAAAELLVAQVLCWRSCRTRLARCRLRVSQSRQVHQVGLQRDLL